MYTYCFLLCPNVFFRFFFFCSVFRVFPPLLPQNIKQFSSVVSGELEAGWASERAWKFWREGGEREGGKKNK